LITFLFTAIFLWLLEKERKRHDAHSLSISKLLPKRLMLLPLLMMIWANSHGGFAVGFILVGIYIIGSLDWLKTLDFNSHNLKPAVQYLKPLLIVTPILILAVCINPYGPVMLLYPFKTVRIEALQEYIQEWQSPDFRSTQFQPFVWLLLLTLGAVGASRKRLSLNDFILVGGFTYLSFLAARNIALFALVTPMVLTKHAEPVLQGLRRNLRNWQLYHSKDEVSGGSIILNWVILVVLLLAVGIKAFLVYPESANDAVFQESLPVEAVEFLRSEQPEGRLFNSYDWGGYLLWTLPEYPVYVDGRTDLYGDEVINQWLQVVLAQDGWQDVLRRWNVKVILLEPQRPVVGQLEDEGWKLEYEDVQAVVYTH
jgi:hypothetical protein